MPSEREDGLAERVISALSAPHPQARGEEPVAVPSAWRWRPKGAVTWIYDPEPQWLAEQGFGAPDCPIEAEPLYARPSEATAGREGMREGLQLAWDAVHKAGKTTGADHVLACSVIAREISRLALPASRNGVDTDGADVKPQGPVGHYTGRPITG